MTLAANECFEEAVLSRVALDTGQARIVVLDLNAAPDGMRRIFAAVARVGINVDVIVHGPARETETLSFTVPLENQLAAIAAVRSLLKDAANGNVTSERVAKLSLWGTGIMSHGDVATVLFGALANAGINIEMICTSELVISVVVDPARADEAFDAVCAAFEFVDEPLATTA